MKVIKSYFQTNKEWRIDRARDVGASAIGTICGENAIHGHTPLTLAKKMKQELQGEFDFTQTIAQKRGHAYESGVADMFSDETGIQIIKASAAEYTVRRDDMPWVHCSPDRVYWIDNNGPKHGKVSENNKGMLECKTTTRMSPIEEIPMSWKLQLQLQLGICGYKEGYLAWDCLGCPSETGFGYMRFDFNEKIFLEASALCRYFFEHYVIGDETPAPINREDVASLYPHPKEESIVAGQQTIELLREYVEIGKRMSADKNRKDELADLIACKFGDHDTLVTDQGIKLATYKATAGRTSVDTTRLKGDYPDIYKACLKEGKSSRTLKIVAK